jgi:hypothetical protein
MIGNLLTMLTTFLVLLTAVLSLSSVRPARVRIPIRVSEPLSRADDEAR